MLLKKREHVVERLRDRGLGRAIALEPAKRGIYLGDGVGEPAFDQETRHHLGMLACEVADRIFQLGTRPHERRRREIHAPCQPV